MCVAGFKAQVFVCRYDIVQISVGGWPTTASEKLFLSLSHTHSRSHSLPLFFFLTVTLSPTHTGTPSPSLGFSHSRTHTHIVSHTKVELTAFLFKLFCLFSAKPRPALK